MSQIKTRGLIVGGGLNLNTFLEPISDSSSQGNTMHCSDYKRKHFMVFPQMKSIQTTSDPETNSVVHLRLDAFGSICILLELHTYKDTFNPL